MHKQHRRRGAFGFLAAALTIVAVVATAAPAGAQDSTPGPRPQPRIVGGTEATAGAWPSQVALLFHDDPDNNSAQYCGGTVLSATWVLTARHCLYRYSIDHPPVALTANDIDVLSGTNDLEHGGTRTPAAELVKFSQGFDQDTLQNDLALVRLSSPTRARAMPYVAQGATLPTGTDLVTIGWGVTDPEVNNYPVKLRQVHVPAIADGTCQGAYPAAPLKVYLSSMLCAGDMAGGVDSCFGDSGGPLARKVNGIWVEVGIVSWGPQGACAEPGQPGVYTRLSAFSNWVADQTRLGPHQSVGLAAYRMFADFYGRAPTGPEFDSYVDWLTDQPAWVVATYLVAGAQWQRTAGDVSRLYEAYFARTGDTSGLRFWTGKLQHGGSLGTVSSSFAASSEFQSTYGSLSSSAFVNLVYQNTLGRPADSGGLTYWTSQLVTGHLSRSQLMTRFAQSTEFHRRTDGVVNTVVTYLTLVRRVADATEIARWSGLSNGQLNRYLIDSFAYASRF